MSKASFNVNYTVLYWLFLILPLIIIFSASVIYFMDHLSTANQEAVEETQNKILETRLLYSDNCFAKSHGSRVTTGRISQDKFTTDVLHNCINATGRSDPAMKITVRYNNSQDLTEKTLTTKNWETKNIQEDLQVNNYVILVDNNPGMIRFVHKP